MILTKPSEEKASSHELPFRVVFSGTISTNSNIPGLGPNINKLIARERKLYLNKIYKRQFIPRSSSHHDAGSPDAEAPISVR